MAICSITNAHSTECKFSQLPPGFLPYEEFIHKYNFAATSTEQIHPITKSLSQTMHRSLPEGLKQLLDVDAGVVAGLQEFFPTIDNLAPIIAKKIKDGGRVFLVGSGSSGRVALDLAAKCCLAFPTYGKNILGVIAGGDSAFVRAKEGFEDSAVEGEKALSDYQLCSKDTVILISASGSASYNVGCGHASKNAGASVHYFYNSKLVPERTQQLFNRGVNPLCVDIGPQGISGSTRLQAATLAEACLGALLTSTLYNCKNDPDTAKSYPKQLAKKMEQGHSLILDKLETIAQFVQKEKSVFSDPNANFRKLSDLYQQGYVTFIASKNSIREVLIDATETSPTFSTNPIRREDDQANTKKAEFRAYLEDAEDNQQAWQTLLGRNINEQDLDDVNTFLLATEAQGNYSYNNRPKGQGNFSIGVSKLKKEEHLPTEMLQQLKESQTQGGQVGLILICKGKIPESYWEELQFVQNSLLVIQDIPNDPIGIIDTIILKQILNLISNGSMVLENKVHGNKMIDVRAANEKLKFRCITLIKTILSECLPDLQISDEQLYYYVAHVAAKKNENEQQGSYTPSLVKIVLALIALNKSPEDFQEAVDKLIEEKESINWLL